MGSDEKGENAKAEKLEALKDLLDVFPDNVLKMIKFPVLENPRQLIVSDEFTQPKVYSFDPLSNTCTEREKLLWRVSRFEEFSQNSFVTQTLIPPGVQVWEFNSSIDEYKVRVEFKGATHFQVFGRLIYLVYFDKCMLWDPLTGEDVESFSDSKFRNVEKVSENSFCLSFGDEIEFYKIFRGQVLFQGSISKCLTGMSGIKHLGNSTYILVSKEGDILAEIPIQKGFQSGPLKYKFLHRFVGSVEVVVSGSALLVRKDTQLRLWLKSGQSEWLPSSQSFNCTGSERQGNFFMVYEISGVSSGIYRWDGASSRLAQVHVCACVGRPEIKILSSEVIAIVGIQNVNVSTFSGEQLCVIPFQSPRIKTLPPRPSQISGTVRLLEKTMPVASPLVEVVVRFLCIYVVFAFQEKGKCILTNGT
jgi:hypothetical protein